MITADKLKYMNVFALPRELISFENALKRLRITIYSNDKQSLLSQRPIVLYKIIEMLWYYILMKYFFRGNHLPILSKVYI